MPEFKPQITPGPWHPHLIARCHKHMCFSPILSVKMNRNDQLPATDQDLLAIAAVPELLAVYKAANVLSRALLKASRLEDTIPEQTKLAFAIEALESLHSPEEKKQ